MVEGHPQPIDWGKLLTGKPPRPEELQRFIQLQPALDYDALEPGKRADDEIRKIANDLGLPKLGVRVRLTGEVPLTDEDDELAETDAEHAVNLAGREASR